MIKLLSCLIFIFIATSTIAQSNHADSIKSPKNLFKDDDDLLKMLDSINPAHSYVKLSVGIGNKLFSVKNNSINATQANVNKIYYTPSIAYLHKSGFSVGVMPFLTSDNGSLTVYQTALSSGYDFSNDIISVGLSYTHYFADNQSYSSNSIFQHDIYSYIQYSKSYISPVISVGYSAGNFNEINTYSVPALNNRIIRDSTKNNIQNFSVSVGIEHGFFVDNVFTKKDAFNFTPQLMLLAGSEKFTTTHINKLDGHLLKKSNRVKSRTETTNAGLSIQALALSLDASYNVGKFYVSPNVYFNYYLPQTTDKRLSSVFSIAFGVKL